MFDKHAKDYDLWYIRQRKVYESEVLAIRALKLDGFGLDVGVGSGALACKANVSVGIDPSYEMLKIAKSRGIECIVAVGEFLPFKNFVFDFALITLTFCFLKNPKSVLNEVKRVIKDNGHLAICIVAKDSTWGELYMKKAKEGHKFYKFAKFYTFKELCIVLKDNFEIVNIKATLSYSPSDKHVIEEPSDEVSGKGFICVKCKKIAY
jgi:ubiquinone/menaquinone biosynthesis C-methylase UbiE